MLACECVCDENGARFRERFIGRIHSICRVVTQNKSFISTKSTCCGGLKFRVRQYHHSSDKPSFLNDIKGSTVFSLVLHLGTTSTSSNSLLHE
jgi:hypothetical protein